MRRGTTPTHTFETPFDAEMIKGCRVVYAQNRSVILTKETGDCMLTGNLIKVKLTQKETLRFHNNKAVEIQLRVLLANDESFVSDIKDVHVLRCLDDEVLA